jgi:hypothetical protein
LAQDLPALRARGEGQSIEYMRGFPEQARELAKEIAAFASSNAGTILIGVGDDGSLVGLEPVPVSPADRDQLLRRVEGICHGVIKPAVTPTVRFASEGTRVVMVVDVPKGREPVYYCQNIPYVRHLSQSRPAEPTEVVALVSDFLRGSRSTSESDGYASALSGVVFPVAEVLILADQLRERRLNPWIGQLKSSFASAARSARSSAANEHIHSHGHSDILLRFSRATEAVALHRPALGQESWREFEKLVAEAAAVAKDIDSSLTSLLHQDQESTQRYVLRVRAFGREIADIAARIHERRRGDALAGDLGHASMIGANLLHAYFFPFNHIPEPLRRKLWTSGRSLHVAETLRISHSDGDIDTLQDSLEKAAVDILDFADGCQAALRNGGA